MNDIDKLIYDELVELRKDFKDYIEKMETRVSSLEEFKNKTLGVFIFVGALVGLAIDYLKGKVL